MRFESERISMHGAAKTCEGEYVSPGGKGKVVIMNYNILTHSIDQIIDVHNDNALNRDFRTI